MKNALINESIYRNAVNLNNLLSLNLSENESINQQEINIIKEVINYIKKLISLYDVDVIELTPTNRCVDLEKMSTAELLIMYGVIKSTSLNRAQTKGWVDKSINSYRQELGTKTFVKCLKNTQQPNVRNKEAYLNTLLKNELASIKN